MSALASARRLAPARLRGVCAALAPSPRLRRRLVIVVLSAVVVAATYMLWLRDSGLVAVKEVQVTTYHVLWELVHVFFEQPGVLAPEVIA